MPEKAACLSPEKAVKLRNYKELNRFAQKGAILFTGSSLMEQFPIAEYCLSAGIDRVVYNRGVGGFTTDEFIQNMDTVLFDLEPSKIFINIGTNDINAAAFGVAWQERLLKNYAGILRRISSRLPGAAVYVMAYYPVNFRIPSPPLWAATRTNGAVNDTNLKLRDLARTMGVYFIDANGGLRDGRGDLREEITLDGVHISAGGYRTVFEAIRQYL